MFCGGRRRRWHTLRAVPGQPSDPTLLHAPLLCMHCGHVFFYRQRSVLCGGWPGVSSGAAPVLRRDRPPPPPRWVHRVPGRHPGGGRVLPAGAAHEGLGDAAAVHHDPRRAGCLPPPPDWCGAGDGAGVGRDAGAVRREGSCTFVARNSWIVFGGLGRLQHFPVTSLRCVPPFR